MNQQNGYDVWAALGLKSPLDASYGATASALQGQNTFDLQMRGWLQSGQAARGSQIGQQQAMQAWPSPEAMAAVQKYMDNNPETKERRAQRMAQEVRERKPSMQVQRRTRREA